MVSIASAVAGPVSGKLLDILGQRVVLLPRLLIHSGSLLLLTLGGMAGVSHWSAYALAAVVGATVPQMGSLTRTRWSHALGGRDMLPTAFSLEALTDDVTFVVGPPLATLLAVAVDPSVPLFVVALLTLFGGLAFLAGRRTEPAIVADDKLTTARGLITRGAMKVKGMPPLAVSFIGLGGVFGAMQVSVVAFSEHSGNPAAAGPIYAVFAVASILSGFGYGIIAWRRSPVSRMLLAFFFLAAACLILIFVNDVALMWILVGLPGVAIAPAMITASVLIDERVPKSVLTEAYTWLSSMTGLGIALGASAAGRIVDVASAQGGFAVGAVAAAFSSLLIFFARGRLSISKPPFPVISSELREHRTDGGKC